MVFAFDVIVGRMPNADPQAWELVCVEMIDNIFQPIVASSAASCPQAYFTNRQVKFIVDNQHIFWLNFIPAHEFSNRLATEIHKGYWFCEYYFLKPNGAARQDCPAAPLRPFPAMFCCEFIYNAITRVVASAFIFWTWISKTNNQFHSGLATISQAYRKVMRKPCLNDLLLRLLKCI